MTDTPFDARDKEGFPLTKGTVIIVPSRVSTFFEQGNRAKEFSNTPLVASMRPVKGESGRYKFATREGQGGKKMFVPEGLKGGEKLRIVWGVDEDPKSACAELVQ